MVRKLSTFMILSALVPGLALAAPPKAGAAKAEGPSLNDVIDKVDRGMVDDRAIAALRAAAEGGSGPAAQRLGYLYLAGIGMEMNLPHAYRWYCAAAVRNVPYTIDMAIKIFNRMSPSARVMAEGMLATHFSAGDLARLSAMKPMDTPMQASNPGADNGSTQGK